MPEPTAILVIYQCPSEYIYKEQSLLLNPSKKKLHTNITKQSYRNAILIIAYYIYLWSVMTQVSVMTQDDPVCLQSSVNVSLISVLDL